ncbi:alkane hydroxylase MAH1 [Spinacia oleracea]|uniref:Alkane hydroxylase MAH1 n=1 Tax=Spinacia oleracea TaxID=3562 RepID=A0A9R0J8P0_SPIOL|nr:alkane hydroxylase MAH1-like [Spinacia oleracea]
MVYMVIITLLISFVFCCYFFGKKNGLPTNWPLVGMLPALLKNAHRINDFMIEVMEKSDMIFQIKGPWFTNMNLLLTVDPANIYHVSSKKFGNYGKGAKLNEILEPLGDGILNTDSNIWLFHRNVAQSFTNHPKFHQLLVNTTFQKVESGLIPILDHVCKDGIEIDLHDVFSRFMYDVMSIIMMDHDPSSLTVELPNFPLLKAVPSMEKVGISRHVVPTCIWKFQRWLNVGEEKRLKQETKIVDDFIYECIDRKKEKILIQGASSSSKDIDNEVSHVDLLTLLILDENKNTKSLVIQNNDKFLRDTITNFFLAGGETTSVALGWFFYLLSKNPRVLQKIKEELNTIMIPLKDQKNNIDRFLRNFKEVSNKLIYLHATICEVLRLYPSVAFTSHTPVEPDILPSGHLVNPNMQIIFNLYAMGRMKSIWGDDCNEFKPERFISEGNVIKHEPSYKYSVFSGGPRSCIGKQMVFIQMKIVAAIVIQNYHIQVKQHDHVPDSSFILHMKDEFKVKVFRSQ